MRGRLTPRITFGGLATSKVNEYRMSPVESEAASDEKRREFVAGHCLYRRSVDSLYTAEEGLGVNL
jgi:hypothetical protein